MAVSPVGAIGCACLATTRTAAISTARAIAIAAKSRFTRAGLYRTLVDATPCGSRKKYEVDATRTNSEYALEMAGSYPLLFDLGGRSPTTREVASAVKEGGTAALTEAERRA